MLETRSERADGVGPRNLRTRSIARPCSLPGRLGPFTGYAEIRVIGTMRDDKGYSGSRQCSASGGPGSV
jgi:hypothetical protein